VAILGGNTEGSLCSLSNSTCSASTSCGSGQSYCDSYCHAASSPCIKTRTLIHDFAGNSLTWKAYCENSCPRNADHFPYIGFQETWNSCVTSFSTCSGPNIYNTVPSITGTWPKAASDNVDPTVFSEMNSSSPSNFIWLTPTDGHNMHDNNVTSGDYYIRSLLVGTGTVKNPAAGSLLASNLFTNPSFRTVLYLWWDEYDPSPNVIFGAGIKVNYVSSQSYDEFNSAHTIQRNWGLPYTTSVVAADSSLTDVFIPTLIATGPGSITQCDNCTRLIQYYMTTVDLSGTATYSTNAWNIVSFSPASGTHSMSLDDQLVVTMTWNLTGSHCSTGTLTTTLSVGGASQRVSSHIICVTAPKP